MRTVKATAWVLGLLSALVSPLAWSQAQVVGGNVQLNAFRPAVDSRGYVTVNASQVLGHKDVSFGLVSNWGKNMLRFESDSGDSYEVSNIFTSTLVGAFGLKLGPVELEFGASVPFVVMNGAVGKANNRLSEHRKALL